MAILESFLNRLENDVRQGKTTLEQAYEEACRHIKPYNMPYRKEMKPDIDALQAWYERLAPELGINIDFILEHSAAQVKDRQGWPGGSLARHTLFGFVQGREWYSLLQ